jgi:hypothetical protein
MTTNTLQTFPSARHNAINQVNYLRANVVFGAANGVAVVLGAIPAGSIILKAMSGVQVNTVFNAGTLNTLDVGSAATGTLFSAAGSLTALAFVPLNAATGVFRVASDTVITFTPNLTGTAATTGDADVFIAYIENI